MSRGVEVREGCREIEGKREIERREIEGRERGEREKLLLISIYIEGEAETG